MPRHYEPPQYEEVEVSLVRQTDAGALVHVLDIGEEFWVGKSKCSPETEWEQIEPGEIVSLEVEDWVVRKWEGS